MKSAYIFIILNLATISVFSSHVSSYQIPQSEIEFEPNPYEQEEKSSSLKIYSKKEEIKEKPITNLDIEENNNSNE